jgi:hypothetical protein
MSDGSLFQCKATHAGGMRCSSVRRDANHWFVIWLDADGADGLCFCTVPFDEEAIAELKALGADPHWVCGQSCAQRLYERYLATGSIA